MRLSNSGFSVWPYCLVCIWCDWSGCKNFLKWILGSKCRCSTCTICTRLSPLFPNYCMTVTCFGHPLSPSSGSFQEMIGKLCEHVMPYILLNNELWDPSSVHVDWKQAMFKSFCETNKFKQCIAECLTVSICSISVHIINHYNILLNFHSYLWL